MHRIANTSGDEASARDASVELLCSRETERYSREAHERSNKGLAECEGAKTRVWMIIATLDSLCSSKVNDNSTGLKRAQRVRRRFSQRLRHISSCSMVSSTTNCPSAISRQRVTIRLYIFTRTTTSTLRARRRAPRATRMQRRRQRCARVLPCFPFFSR